MSSPVSGRGRSIRSARGLDGAVPGGIVGDSVLPAAPGQTEPGSGQDAGGGRTVLAWGDLVGVRRGRPRGGAAGVGGEESA